MQSYNSNNTRKVGAVGSAMSTAHLIMAAMVAKARSMFGLGLSEERAMRLQGHVSPAHYRGGGRSVLDYPSCPLKTVTRFNERGQRTYTFPHQGNKEMARRQMRANKCEHGVPIGQKCPRCRRG